MSGIDPEKLGESIKWARHIASCGHDTDNLTTLANAAERTLARLPRFKEVERECWEVVSDDGICRGFFPTENAASGIARLAPDRHVVRLTGTAKVKVNP